MIHGTIAAHQGRIPIHARGQELGLRWKTKGNGVLADGTVSEFDVFDGVIRRHGRSRRISVVSMSAVPLIGMALLEGNELIMKVRQGEAVTIKAMRRRRSR